jgi:tetratricopeptide (TPR) repeat protein
VDLPLDPLSAGDTAALARHLRRDFGPVAELHRRTGGNPLFVIQTLARFGESAGEPWTPAVRDAIRARLGHLDGGLRTLLQAGAVLNDGFTLRVASAVAGLEGAESAKGLDELCRRGLLRTRGATFTFPHDCLREVALEEIPGARRAGLHDRALDLLAETGRRPHELLAHALAGGREDRVPALALEAGDEAMALGAAAAAATDYSAAGPGVRLLETGSARRLFERWGRALELDTRLPEAGEVYTRMLTEGERRGSPALPCAALNRLPSLALYAQGDPAGAMARLRDAAAVAPLAGDDLVAETELQTGNALLYALLLDEGRRHLDQALAAARRDGDRHLTARVLNTITYAHLQEVRFEKALAATEEAAAAFLERGDRSMAADALAQRAAALLQAGRPREAEEAARRALSISDDIDNDWGRANAGKELAPALLDQGRVAEAGAAAEACLSASRSAGFAPLVVFGLCHVGAHRLLGGDVEGAVQLHGEAAGLADGMEAPLLNRMMGELAWGHLCGSLLAAGHLKRAREAADRSLGARRPGHLAWAVLRPAQLLALEFAGERDRVDGELVTLAGQTSGLPRHELARLEAVAAVAAVRGLETEAAEARDAAEAARRRIASA